MKKLQCTCQYLVGENGYRAESKEVAVGKKTRIHFVHCSSTNVLKTLVERWTRQGMGIYKYTIEPNDEIVNSQARFIDYEPRESAIGSELAWYGHQQHDHIFVKIKEK
jgi:hypothetical protein